MKKTAGLKVKSTVKTIAPVGNHSRSGLKVKSTTKSIAPIGNHSRTLLTI